jgi:transposase
MQLDAIPVSLGIDGFEVIASDEREDVIEVVIQTIVPAGCCPDCGHADAVPKERRSLLVRDLPVRPGKQTWLVWWKRRFACPRCGRTFTETHDEIPARATHTRRFDRYLAARTVESPYARVADEEGVSFYRIERASRRHAEGWLEDRWEQTPERLCIDEQSHRRGQVFNTVISDPDARRVLELVETRNQGPVQDFLASLAPEAKAAIKEVCIDMFEPYRCAVRAALPHVTIVADPFHIQRLGSQALDAVRREAQRIPDAKGWKRPLFRARHKLLRGRTRLRLIDLDDLADIFVVYPQLHIAWELMWQVRSVYDASDRVEAQRRLHLFYQHAEASGLRPFITAAASMRSWEAEILAHFDSGLTNAYAEGITNKIKVIKRTGYGFRNFANFRRRVLVACN